MNDTPDQTPDDETIEQRMKRLGIEKDNSRGSTVTFRAEGTAAMRKLIVRRESPPDTPA